MLACPGPGRPTRPQRATVPAVAAGTAAQQRGRSL